MNKRGQEQAPAPETPEAPAPAPSRPTQPAPAKPSGMRPEWSIWRKIWWFIWEDNSIWSWLVNILLAFVIIKFFVYPGLGLILGTSYPIVAVVSGSMEHDGTFDAWWTTTSCDGNAQSDLYDAYGIAKTNFESFSFKNGFNKGDLMVLSSAKNLERGDIVVFGAGLQDPIIHRVVALTPEGVTTKGDHNCASAPFERNIPQEGLLGKAVFRLPYLGWVKIGFVEFIKLITGRN